MAFNSVQNFNGQAFPHQSLKAQLDMKTYGQDNVIDKRGTELQCKALFPNEGITYFGQFGDLNNILTKGGNMIVTRAKVLRMVVPVLCGPTTLMGSFSMAAKILQFLVIDMLHAPYFQLKQLPASYLS